MRLRDGKLLFSPSDLTNFMESRFVSFMDRLYVEKDPRAVKDAPDEGLEIIRERGVEHEKTFLESLKQDGRDVCEIPEDGPDGFELTKHAMREGRAYIYQAHLQVDRFAGKCDFLIRVDGRRSERLDTNYSYEPCDTKLARKPKPYFAVQLCSYAEMLAAIQGALPESFVVILGDGTSRTFRTEDYFYYYRQLKSQFLEFQDNFDPACWPDEIEIPPFCDWKTAGDKVLTERDDLSRVANIRKSQIVKLQKAGIHSLTELATTSATSVDRMSDETFSKLKEQADLQYRSRDLEKPLFKLLAPDPDDRYRGLAILPPPSKNDVWFDMEGYPHVDGGLEYLFGASYIENESLKFFERWAHDEGQEQIAFEEFVDWIYGRFKDDPTMHVYHYAAYEQTALRRLMGKFASREFEIDQLLRHDVFVDLYTVVRQSIRVGEPKYSIKNLEHIYRGKRAGDVSTAMDSVIWYYKWLEERDGNDFRTSKILSSIRDYNIEDCESTYELCNWLRELQKESGVTYLAPPEPGEQEEQEDEATALARLVLEVHGDGAVPTMLSYLLNFHKREEKPVWWALFDKRNWTTDELYGDLDSIAGLQATSRWDEPSARSKLFEFTFDPDQETKIEIGDTVCFYREDGSLAMMTVKELDTDTGRIALTTTKEPPPTSMDIVKKELTGIKTISNAIFEIVSDYCSGKQLPPALAQFLERAGPRIRNHPAGEPIIANLKKDLLPQIVDVIHRLDNSLLCIQGPPGAGKTYTGAQAVLSLLSSGKRVGITSNSHKAIEVLLNAVAKEASSQEVRINGVKIGKDSREAEPPTFATSGIEYKRDAKGVFDNFDLIGGTAYAFSRPEAAGTLDYLFVDEAGQVSVANLVGMSRCAHNIVLLGDQMQLDQPIKGSHPGDSGLSTLQYYLEDYSAIPPDMGIFLDTTKRLHPLLCEFISSAVYSGRLTNLPSTAERRIINANKRRIGIEAGLLFEAVAHTGCVQSSEEEVERIRELIDELRDCELEVDGTKRPLNPEKDVLIVAPYNKHVRLLKTSLPGFEIGTVDKFQGKEKPIVIVSMAESDSNESARGLDFLFSKNRLNVAISRAQVLAIVVANPSLAFADCGSLKSMSLINLFSRIVQHGSGQRLPKFSYQTDLSAFEPSTRTSAALPPSKTEPSPGRVMESYRQYHTKKTDLVYMVIESLGLPSESWVEQRLSKKLLLDQLARTAADRRQVQEGVEELFWIAALKPTNVGIPSYHDDEREYLEIEVLTLVLKAGARSSRIQELVHRAIPYPVLLIVRQGESVSISVAHKRWSQGKVGKVVLDEVRKTDPVNNVDSKHFESLLESIGISRLPSDNLHSTYQGLAECLLAWQVSKVTGGFTVPRSREKSVELLDRLELHNDLLSQLKALETKASREKQINRRVALNMEIKRIKLDLANIAKSLNENSPSQDT